MSRWVRCTASGWLAQQVVRAVSLFTLGSANVVEVFMSVGLLGRKVGMTQVHDADGNAIPVTVIEAGPCVVLQCKTTAKDGYEAVQVGFGDKPRRLASRAERGHVAEIDSRRSKALAAQGAVRDKAGCEPQRYVREFRVDANASDYKVGQKLDVKLFGEISHVDVIGDIKGRGTAGVMKHFGFGGLPASHGVKRHHRAPGSVGSHGCDRGHSGKIKRGKRMTGRWGDERRTVQNLKVVRIDEANNLLLVRGAIPGPNGGMVMIRKTRVKKKVAAPKK